MKKKKRYEMSIKELQTRRGQIDHLTNLHTSYLIILLCDQTMIIRGIFKESGK